MARLAVHDDPEQFSVVFGAELTGEEVAGRFHLHEELGRGSFGRTCRATVPATGEQVRSAGDRARFWSVRAHLAPRRRSR